MSFFKRISSAFDSEINSFTKILQRQRGLQIGPTGSAQGFFYQVGVSSAGNAMSPEATLSRILKEWIPLRGWPLDTQLSLLEVRALDNKYVAPDSITSLEEWVAWRLPLAFPRHQVSVANGWTPDFYAWAISRAKEHF